MEASEVKRMLELEEENTKLKKMFAELSLENHAMKELFAKKGGDSRSTRLCECSNFTWIISHASLSFKWT